MASKGLRVDFLLRLRETSAERGQFTEIFFTNHESSETTVSRSTIPSVVGMCLLILVINSFNCH